MKSNSAFDAVWSELLIIMLPRSWLTDQVYTDNCTNSSYSIFIKNRTLFSWIKVSCMLTRPSLRDPIGQRWHASGNSYLSKHALACNRFLSFDSQMIGI